MVRKIINLIKHWGFWNSIVYLLYKRKDKIWAQENYKYNLIDKSEFSLLSVSTKLCKINLNGKKIYLRRFSSDIDVFKQLIADKEYDGYINKIKQNNIAVKNIIDAGSNIGLAAFVFLEAFPDSILYCIEASSNNLKQLKLNFSKNRIQANILHFGLWNKDTTLYLQKGFRDGKEWGDSVTETPTGNERIPAISVDSLIKKYKIDSIDILKMDIEGSEFGIFAEGQNLDFLRITKSIAIEIHPELGNESDIVSKLKSYNFNISKSGEYFIGINKTFLQ